MTTEKTPAPKPGKPVYDIRQWQSRRVFLTLAIGMAVALVCVYIIDPRQPVMASLIVGGATLLAWFLTGFIFRPPRRR